jgi:predicted ArsR family transcriptional regulator
MLAALDELETADTELADAARSLRVQVQAFRRHIERGGSLTDPAIVDRIAKRRAALTGAIKHTEHARHESQRLLYELARSEGMSVAAIARAWGVSRQLISRALNEDG